MNKNPILRLCGVFLLLNLLILLPNTNPLTEMEACGTHLPEMQLPALEDISRNERGCLLMSDI